MEAVRGSCPWTWTAGFGKIGNLKKKKKKNLCTSQFFLSCRAEKKPLVLDNEHSYLLHVNLWLSVHVLLGIANSCCILVLRYSTHGGSCCGSCSGWSGAHGLSGWRGGKKKKKKEKGWAWNIITNKQKSYRTQLCVDSVSGLTDSLGGHHAGHLGGRPHCAEGLRARAWGTYSTRHVLEVYGQIKSNCY